MKIVRLIFYLFIVTKFEHLETVKGKISSPELPGKKEDNQITVDLQQLFS